MQKRTILITTLSAVIFIIIPLVIFFIYATQTLLFSPHGYISLATVPNPVQVTTKGRSVSLTSNQRYPVETGSNTIIFSSDGFQSKTIHITIKKNETSTIPVQLTPLTDAAKKEVADPKYQNTLQQITALTMKGQVQDLEKNNPIISDLPISANDYEINPCNQEGNVVSICVTSFIPGTDYMQQEALDKLKSLGYDLSKYQIYLDGTLYTGN